MKNINLTPIAKTLMFGFGLFLVDVNAYAVTVLPPTTAPNGVVRAADSATISLGELSRSYGNQDSSNIDGILNCNNFIVKKQPFEVRHCPPNLGNSYRSGELANYYTQYLARFVGLDRLILTNSQAETKTGRENSYKQQNYRNLFAIQEACQFNPAYAQNVGYLIGFSWWWSGDRENYNNFWSRMNSLHTSRDPNVYYRKPSTKTNHQLLKVDQKYLGYQNCFPKCLKLEEIRKYNGTFKEEVLNCERGTGTIIKRYYYSARVPTELNSIVNTGSQDFYVNQPHCDSLTGSWRYRGGIDDTVNCTTQQEASNVKIHGYFDRDRFNATNERRYMKLSITGEDLFSDVISKKYIFITDKTADLQAYYTSIFSDDNINKIKSIKIITDPVLLPERHKKEEQYMNNIITGTDLLIKEDGTPVTEADKIKTAEQLKVLQSYNNEIPVTIMFVDKGNMNSKFVIQNQMFSAGTLLQKDLINAGCFNIGFMNPSNNYYLNKSNESIRLGCFNLQDKNFDFEHNVRFGYSDYNWNSTKNEIDITDLVKRKLIPFVGYIVNDDKVKRDFAVHFVIEYNDDGQYDNNNTVDNADTSRVRLASSNGSTYLTFTNVKDSNMQLNFTQVGSLMGTALLNPTVNKSINENGTFNYTYIFNAKKVYMVDEIIKFSKNGHGYLFNTIDGRGNINFEN